MPRPTTNGDRKRRTPKRSAVERTDTALAVSDLLLCDEALRGLIDDWIVPALVEQFLGDKKALPDSSEEGHN